jgi:hypothetical protein
MCCLDFLAGASSDWWDNGGRSAAVADGLRALQHPSRCPPSAVEYPDLMQSGLGSSLMLISAALSDAYIQQLPWTPPATAQFSQDVKCASLLTFPMSCLYFLKTFYDIASIVLNAFIFYAICV